MFFSVLGVGEVCGLDSGAKVVELRTGNVPEVVTGWGVVVGQNTGYLLISQFASQIAIKRHPEPSVLLYITSPV